MILPSKRPSATESREIELLTGIRTGKGTFYSEFRGAAERLERAVHALDTISRALVQTVEGPEQLVRAVAEAARSHLAAEWVLIALADGALPEAQPRHLILDATGRAYAFEGLQNAEYPGNSLPS